MGCYINPRDMDKEEWLRLHGETTQGPTPITETHVPVCLVDNGPFTAAGVAFNEREVQAFSYPDGRFKIWFRVAREDARKVSDLANWEKEKGRTR